MEEMLKTETERVVRKINQHEKEIAKVKQLVVQEKENFESKFEDPTEIYEKRGLGQDPPSNARRGSS